MGVTTAIVGAGALAAAGGVASGAMGASAAESAADTQAQAARSAADSQLQAARESNQLQWAMYQQNQANMRPWLTAGQGALGVLESGLLPAGTVIPGTPGTPGHWEGSSAPPSGPDYENWLRNNPDYATFADYGVFAGPDAPAAYQQYLQRTGSGGGQTWVPGTPGTPDQVATGYFNKYPGGAFSYPSFSYPEFKFTEADFKADPGYQWSRQQGINAIDASAAARGAFGSGSHATALTDYATNLANQEYGQVYNRALGQWMNNYGLAANTDLTNYQRALQSYGLGYGQWTDQYNRIAALANVGQTQSQVMGNLGQNAASAIGANTMYGANAAAQGINNAAAANAAGILGSANAWSGALQGVNNQAMSGLGTYLNYQQNQNLLNAFGMNSAGGGGNSWSNAYSPYSSGAAYAPATTWPTVDTSQYQYANLMGV